MKSQTHTKTFIKQSFAEIKPSCGSGECKEECCDTKSHDCGTEGCSGNCSGNLCGSFQYTVLAEIIFFDDSSNALAGFSGNDSLFYYQNPTYSGGFHTIWQPPKIG